MQHQNRSNDVSPLIEEIQSLEIRPILKEDFKRIVTKYKPKKDSINDGLSEYDVLKSYYIICDYFVSKESVFFGVKSFNLLSSAVQRQEIGFGETFKWNDPYHKMATLLYGITKNHAFEDGNKRTALLALLLHIDRAKLQVKCKQKELEELIVRIAANLLSEYKDYKSYTKKDDPEINFIADKIRKYTRKTDKTIYTITYEKFNQKLNKYDVFLEEPNKGYINVYKIIEGRSRYLRRPKKTKIKLLQIGFPGWKKQINPKAIKSVLSKAGLTPENGIDSAVFFKDADSIHTLLIEAYKKPLAKLRDK